MNHTKNYSLELIGSTWCLIETDTERMVRRFWTKAEALSFSLAYIERHGGSLDVHRAKDARHMALKAA